MRALVPSVINDVHETYHFELPRFAEAGSCDELAAMLDYRQYQSRVSSFSKCGPNNFLEEGGTQSASDNDQ